MKLLFTFILLSLPVIGFISCQDDSRVDDLQRETEELTQNSSDLGVNNAREKKELVREEKKTRMEEKFPANTYAVATQKRVYFHSKPDKATKLKSFIISGQYCTIEKVKYDFGYISFDYKNKMTRGWINLKYIEPYKNLQPEDNTNQSSDLQFNVTTPPPDVVAPLEVVDVEEEIIDFPDVEATFPGGGAAMQRWIANNVKYPQTAIEMNEQGRVYLSFVVEPNGSITNISIERGVSSDLDREAKRLLRKMPKWTAGEARGRKARTRCRLPINFQLN